MAEQYVQINISQGPLEYDAWGTFQDETILALRQSVKGESTNFIELHEGMGSWGYVMEPSLHVSIVADVDLFALRAKLADLKKTFNQDAIALIAGSDLI